MKLVRENNEIVCENIKVASSFDERLLGLMFKKSLVGYGGLLIKPCNSIHTFFMKMSIDVIFLDKNLKVVKVIKDMKPWRLSKIYFKSNQVLEMKAGDLKVNLTEGEVLREYV